MKRAKANKDITIALQGKTKVNLDYYLRGEGSVFGSEKLPLMKSKKLKLYLDGLLEKQDTDFRLFKKKGKLEDASKS